MSRIAVLFTLPVEARRFLRMVRNQRPVGGSAYEGFIGETPVCVGISGMAYERLPAKVCEVMSGDPAALILAGFAGALESDLSAGDLVIAESVIDATAESAVNYMCDARLFELATQLAVRSGRRPGGRRLLASCLVAQFPCEKVDLQHRYNCAAVDMESGPGAAVASELGIPFIAVRAVVDRQQESLPIALADVVRPDGGVRLGTLAASILEHPGLLLHVFRLGMRSRRAARSLAEFLTEYLPLIPLSRQP